MVIGIGIAILAITLYYSIVSTWYLAILIASIILTIAISYVINTRIKSIKLTVCPYC